MTGHRVRVGLRPGQHVAVCACGWRMALETPRGAAWAAEAHCFTVEPDRAVEEGMDEGGRWWAPETL